MNFAQNFSNLMKELENNFKKAINYNDYSKFREMTIVRAKAGAYRDILRPLVYDQTKQNLNSDVKKFDNELIAFQEKCNRQINKILGDAI